MGRALSAPASLRLEGLPQQFVEPRIRAADSAEANMSLGEIQREGRLQAHAEGHALAPRMRSERFG